ncbi:MAG: threonine synthase [Bacteroidales bacterium]|nr:MAG: threonine synthase [Bacteroidales bacterium]
MPVLYISTNGTGEAIPFRKALMQGMAPDKGLYMPTEYPLFNRNMIREFHKMTYPEIACSVIHPFLSEELSEQECLDLANKAYTFDLPLEPVDGNRYLLRLDRGPTCSFKDFGARMMALLVQYFMKDNPYPVTILTATSGDTGSAIASAFYEMENIRVVILFPEKEISTRQRKQMTTLGKNIEAIAVDGKFDDCQQMVKKAFADPDLHPLNLTSANSINVGRLIPQSVYYFYACTRIDPAAEERVLISVPSGNFGNASGCLLAKKMGLPVQKMIFATNSNDTFPKFLYTGIYRKIEPSIPCISSAMNVGHPSNLARIVNLYGGKMDETGLITVIPDMKSMCRDIFSMAVSEEQTRNTISHAFREYGIMLEPHGAIGWAGLDRFLEEERPSMGADSISISLETAHPAKFPEEITDILQIDPDPPTSIKALDDKQEKIERIDKRYQPLKEHLLGCC